ncbi:oxygen-independent coproporphyrinogen III oxidase [Niastella yeongjuensis]|uniref:Coproporphyrinogen-III oxidase n=1 Tax=Niastella yeongjuensis TaxID=354355 RepID=A0A1V9E3V0_9BACT|nr:oxygen-independent coproporphyrinogen III oxidase [Niastella yeongjuensis]OQP40800.1 oxygen-independent coproporphyrinogen III oxidase [Niastella yeongjuensis]SEP01299.1 oxygen-independent coproporphyrinogen-3 oxidase [Niastella yeongjuensis]
MFIDQALLQKYNQPTPRYTSYPTVPFWTEGIDGELWKEAVRQRFAVCNQEEGISLYLHLPFCESLCTYCGCNKKITTNHKVEEVYLEAILKEWRLYGALSDAPPLIREIHLGGGTPTFFSPGNLHRLIAAILKDAVIHPDYAFSIEGHPNNTTRQHLEELYQLGFRRISYGVQDLNREVQQIINRIQPFENVQHATDIARAAGFTAVNFDLIYGLPRQNGDRLAHTITQSLSLQPDRIAFYSYAHTPKVIDAQRLINENDLPDAAEKLSLYLLGKELISAQGYANIGMDHFALPGDELYTAWQQHTLHRNFMGYTTQKSGMLLGLGVSAISDTNTAFAQNEKTLGGYYKSIHSGSLAVLKGYFLNKEDALFRRHILDMACQGRTFFYPNSSVELEQWTLPMLRDLQQDGLVDLYPDHVVVTTIGRHFIRNICKAFDLHLLRREAASPQQTFSKAI